jgi:hypothetical protein
MGGYGRSAHAGSGGGVGNQKRCSGCARTARDHKTGVDMRAYWVDRGEAPIGGCGQQERTGKRGMTWERKMVQRALQDSLGPQNWGGCVGALGRARGGTDGWVRAARACVEAGEVRASQNWYSMRTRTATQGASPTA